MLTDRIGWPPVESDFYRFGTFMEETVIQRADLLLAASHNIAKFWADRRGIPLEKIIVPHIAVDATVFMPPSTTESSRPTILFVGRLDREKGVFAVTEAVLRLKEKYPAILFRIVGVGDAEDIKSLDEMIDGSSATQNFEVLGGVPHNELPRYYAECGVFASPAPSEHGVATVNLEAMSCGKPVVACTTGGPPEAVIDGETGVLVPPGEIDALVQALDMLLANPEKGRLMVFGTFPLTYDTLNAAGEAAFAKEAAPGGPFIA